MENKDSRIQWKKIKPTDSARNSVRAQHSTNPVVLRHNSSQVGYPIQWKPVSTSRKNIREVRCLTCSFVHNVGMIDVTENAIDSVQGATASCRANVLSVIPHKKKQESVLTEQSVVGSNWSQPQTAQTPSPPYERKRFNSNSFPSITASSVGAKEGDRINCSEGELVKCKPADWQKETIDDTGNLNNIVSTVQSKNFEATGGITNQGSVTTKRDSYITSQPKLDNGRRERALAAIMKSNSGKKPVRVHLLTGDSILLVFDAKAAVKDVFEQVCTMYSIKESHFFGLSAVVENEHRFMDLKQRLSKYAPKEWGKELKRRASDLSIQPSSVFTIQFQVQYFVEHPRLICNQESRHHYYLQLKRNVLQSKVATKDETLITLAASSLHLDMGTFDPSLHAGRYFDPHEYVPTWFVKKWGVDYFWSHLPALHKEMVETTPFNVQAEYIKQASCIEDVPVHYYKLYKTKKESSPSVLLGIYHQGIRIHHLAPQREEGAHLLDFEFPWNKVGRLFFAAKRFEIYPEDLPASRRLTYYTGSHTRSKYLLRLLRETHSLYMSLTPFVQHLRKLDGRTTKRKYRESYISGKNLEFDGSGSTDERMIVGAGELSPQSNDSKSVLLEKLYKSYTSSTSRGSSHTSGIESDSKQRNEVDDDDDDVDDDDAAQMQDNAFVDDFDPIELDGPPSAGVICVTEAHLEAPQHKSLSVSDLTEQLAGATVARESPSVSETTHSELTLKEEVFDFPEPTSHIDDVTNDVITEPRPLPEVVTPGKVILNSDTLPLKIAHVRESSSEGIPQPGALKHSRSHDALSYISSSETSAFSHVTARKDVPPTQLRSSKTYYDDTHTIPRQHNLSSTDHSNQSSTARSSRRSRDGNNDKSRRHRHRKRSSRDHDGVGGRMHRSASTETGLHQSGNRHRQKSSGKRHHRHKSLHDAKDLADQVEIMVDPASPHFGASLTAQKSLDDLAGSTNSLLSRSDRHNDIPYAFFSGPQDPMTDRLSSRPRVPSPPIPANDIIDSPTSHHRKMSDACQKTMAAQNRKLSDTKLPHERRRKSDAEPRYRPAHGGANGTAGHTPRKVEVLLQSSHEHRRRPVSCIVTSGTPRADTCYEAAKTSRPPAYIDGLNEVIV